MAATNAVLSEQTAGVATAKPRLLVLSHVMPYPGLSGQQQRVRYTLQAARELFHVTFATAVAPDNAEEAAGQLAEACDDVLLLSSAYARGATSKAFHRTVGAGYSLCTGLKFSNYVIGRVNFSPSRVASSLAERHFDCALFEYWYAAESAAVLRDRGIPCVLDTHDILWWARARELEQSRLPRALRRWSVKRYRHREEEAWKKFDGVIAINQKEHEYLRGKLSPSIKLFYAPMGVDLGKWPYSWDPAQPVRLAYYGGLGSRQNREQAKRCVDRIMPRVWSQYPDAELWLIGSNPPKDLSVASSDRRIKVTGYVESVNHVLRTAWAVICPWSGTYGFRSRLVEVMALGVPVVASRDAVFGMGFEADEGLLLGESDDELADKVVRLLADHRYSREQSRLARGQIERLFSFDGTYGGLMSELHGWLQDERRNGQSR